jgi:GDPmannose 4,6-dehydratase
VREFIERAGAELGMRLGWRGADVNEEGIDEVTGKVIVKIDPRYFRPTEVESLLGDASKAKRQLGWQAETSFETLVQEMVKSDLALARRDALVAREGYRTYQNRE